MQIAPSWTGEQRTPQYDSSEEEQEQEQEQEPPSRSRVRNGQARLTHLTSIRARILACTHAHLLHTGSVQTPHELWKAQTSPRGPLSSRYDRRGVAHANTTEYAGYRAEQGLLPLLFTRHRPPRSPDCELGRRVAANQSPQWPPPRQPAERPSKCPSRDAQ